jgi:hypothetical protein
MTNKERVIRRAAIYAMLIAEMSIDEINEHLEGAGMDTMPISSYQMMVRPNGYIDSVNDPENRLTLADHIRKSQSFEAIKNAQVSGL